MARDPYLYSEGVVKRNQEAAWRERAYQEQRKREAAERRKAVDAAWADWNAQEARARVMRIDTASVAPAEDAGWRAIGAATTKLIVLIEDALTELDQPYVSPAAQDADAAGYGYRAGGPDTGNRGIVTADIEEVF